MHEHDALLAACNIMWAVRDDKVTNQSILYGRVSEIVIEICDMVNCSPSPSP